MGEELLRLIFNLYCAGLEFSASCFGRILWQDGLSCRQLTLRLDEVPASQVLVDLHVRVQRAPTDIALAGLMLRQLEFNFLRSGFVAWRAEIRAATHLG